MVISALKHVTFAVNDVAPATTLLPEIPYMDAVAQALDTASNTRPESCSRSTKTLVQWENNRNRYGNGFVRTVNQAYDEHRPLVLSPDMIWLLIAQGVARHVSVNAERLRPLFVSHEGKLLLRVDRDQFVKGFAGNDWENVFAEWSAQIKAHVGARAHGLLVQEFSTTGIVERAAMDITLIDAMKSYFHFMLVTRCGIPAITLEGAPEDWAQLRETVGHLVEFDLDWWTPHLLPVLDQFVSASQSAVDAAFWQEFYKRRDSSGGPWVNGHIVNFFPYLLDSDRNLVRNERWESVLPDVFPSGLSSAPFDWLYLGMSYPMELMAGFVGVAQDTETLALRPEIGWAVRDGTAPKTTALVRAAWLGDINLLAEILVDGADVNAQDERGETAMISAAENSWPKVVRFLLEKGADTTLRNKSGETALDCARRRLSHAIIHERNYHRGLLVRSEAGDREGLEAVIQLLGG